MKKGVTNLTSRRRISVADAALPKCLVLLLDLHNLFSLEKYSFAIDQSFGKLICRVGIRLFDISYDPAACLSM